MVGAAEKLQRAVCAPARQVAGPVHPAARRPERVGHEPLRRQPRPVQIAARQPRPGDIQFPRNPNRNRLKPPPVRNTRVFGRSAPDRDRCVWSSGRTKWHQQRRLRKGRKFMKQYAGTNSRSAATCLIAMASPLKLDVASLAVTPSNFGSLNSIIAR